MNLGNQRTYSVGQRSASFMSNRQQEFSHFVDCRTDYLETYKAGLASVQKTQASNPESSHWTKDSKVIKFTGNMVENIKGLVRSLDCKCGCKQDFAQIIAAFGDKIVRLREERARHKENNINLKRHIESMQFELAERDRRMEQLEENYYIERRDSVPKSQVDRKSKQYHAVQAKNEKLKAENQELRRAFSESQQQCQHLNNKILSYEKQNYDRKNLKNPKEDICLLDDIDPNDKLQQNSLRYSALLIKLERYQKLFKELPMDFQEIAKMLHEYASDLPCFASRQERELYFMATRMNSNLWKKKLEMEIKDMCQRKEQVKRMEEEWEKKRKGVPLQQIVNRQ